MSDTPHDPKGTVRFELRWRDRRVGGSQTPRRFLDFRVGGTSFYDTHQAAVAVCPECGDLGCGAITVVIRREGDTIVFADWPELRFDAREYRSAISGRGRQAPT